MGLEDVFKFSFTTKKNLAKVIYLEDGLER